MGTGTLTAPHFLGARQVPVLVGGLGELSADLHQVLWVGLHQSLGGEQAQVCGEKGEREECYYRERRRPRSSEENYAV